MGKKDNVIHIIGITTSPEKPQSSLQGKKENKVEKVTEVRLWSPDCQTKEFGIYNVYNGVLLGDLLIMHEKNLSRASERLIWQQYRGWTGRKSQPKDIKTNDYCNSPGKVGG